MPSSVPQPMQDVPYKPTRGSQKLLKEAEEFMAQVLEPQDVKVAAMTWFGIFFIYCMLVVDSEAGFRVFLVPNTRVLFPSVKTPRI